MTTSARRSVATSRSPSWTWLAQSRRVAASRSSSLSRSTHRIGTRPASSAAGTLSDRARSVSLKYSAALGVLEDDAAASQLDEHRRRDLAANAPDSASCMFRRVKTLDALGRLAAGSERGERRAHGDVDAGAGENSAPPGTRAPRPASCTSQCDERRAAAQRQRPHAGQRPALEELQRDAPPPWRRGRRARVSWNFASAANAVAAADHCRRAGRATAPRPCARPSWKGSSSKAP